MYSTTAISRSPIDRHGPLLRTSSTLNSELNASAGALSFLHSCRSRLPRRRRRGAGCSEQLDIGRLQPVDATPGCCSERSCSAKTSAAVRQSWSLRGPLLIARATTSRSRRTTWTHRCPSGSTGATGRSCSRSSVVARATAGRRRTLSCRYRVRTGHDRRVPSPGPR